MDHGTGHPMDTGTLRRLAAGPGRGEEELLERLDATLRRRSLSRLAGGVLAIVLMLPIGTEVLTMLQSRPTPAVTPVATAGSDPACSSAGGATAARRAVAGLAAAVVLAGCSDGAPAGDADPMATETESIAILEVTGDESLAGTHEYRQVSEEQLFRVDADIAEQEGLGRDSYAVVIEFLDDGFDWVRLNGNVSRDGEYNLFTEFRIDGERFTSPPCDLEMSSLPPGRTVGTFTCDDVSDAGDDVTVSVAGRFLLTDIHE